MNPYLPPIREDPQPDDALCRKVGHPDDWFPTRIRDAAEPIKACWRCPLIKGCAAAALDTMQRHGVWAGVLLNDADIQTSRDQLREILK
ncbi:WhiB family transcriptional regulator [Nakamurella lactea]|uniref:WhiB family transcriptional regulator n=1 Tax=Nakamurella lactea TaxID=459515 RepID=UPI000685FEE8|nr:WhiB family transcriptional regulator [Nakamurella lactea]